MKRISSTAFYLYLLLFIIFPLGVALRFTPFQNVNIYPHDLVVGLIFILTIPLIIAKITKYKKIITPVIVFNGIALISLILNNSWLSGIEFLVALSYLIRLNLYLSLLFVGVFAFNSTRVALLRSAFLISSLTIVLLGFVQYVFYNNLRNLYYLGWDEHLYRLFSTFLDPNYAGLFFAIFALFIIGKIINQSINDHSNYFYIFICMITLLALVLTYSRTAIISFVIGLAFLLISMKKVKVLVMAIILFGIGIFALSDFSIEGTNPLRVASSEARIISLNEGVEIFLDSPIYGVGFNAYRYAQIEKGFRDSVQSRISNADAGTDNSLLFVLATTGIIGFISYLYLWKTIISTANYMADNKDKLVAFSIVLAMFAGSFFINALFYIPVISWVFIYIGLFIFSNKTNLRT